MTTRNGIHRRDMLRLTAGAAGAWLAAGDFSSAAAADDTP